MRQMKFGIIVFPGTNCDHDCRWVLEHHFSKDVNYVWHKETALEDYDCLIIPGGFSYGDYLRTGAIAKFSSIMKAVEIFAKKGGLVIGICNGFQILLETGLLPGVMLKNKGLRFICKYVNIFIENSETPFTGRGRNGQILKMPIRHAEGNYYIEEKRLNELITNNQIIMKYCSNEGDITEGYNPNGSVKNIAGICNKEKNVFGLMPHPEAACDISLGSDDGKIIFESIIKWLVGS